MIWPTDGFKLSTVTSSGASVGAVSVSVAVAVPPGTTVVGLRVMDERYCCGLRMKTLENVLPKRDAVNVTAVGTWTCAVSIVKVQEPIYPGIASVAGTVSSAGSLLESPTCTSITGSALRYTMTHAEPPPVIMFAPLPPTSESPATASGGVTAR